MRISYEYISQLLIKFLDSEKPHLNWRDFDNEINEDENLFFFHINILCDKEIIVGASSDPNNIGVIFNANSNSYNIWIAPIRLTAQGHDFADALAKPSIKELIVTKFKDEGLSAIINIAKSLAEKHAEKLLGDIVS